MHIPVLLHEVMEGLAPKEGETAVDATLGGGGHARELFRRVGLSGMLVGIDEDEDALSRTKEALKGMKGTISLVRGNFRDIEGIVRGAGKESADKILFDLGVSSYHYEESGRGFSFQRDEPLSMTLGREHSGKFTASEMVNEWDEENLLEIIRAYGEERFAPQIARAIVANRPFQSSKGLAEVIAAAVPGKYRHGRLHPATKTFQALRIAVNDELRSLGAGLEGAYALLRPSGRMAVISFHSLEDRIVKNFFKEKAAEEKMRILTKRPLTAGEEERRANPRARSAKLRIAEKIK